MLDDISLIRKYLRQESTLLSNPQLRIQAPQENVVQLITRNGQLLATADFNHLPPRVSIRPGSNYEALLHKMLVAHHFIPEGQCEGNRFSCYDYHPVPDGYRLHVTPAMDFWKKWWSRHRFLAAAKRGGSQTDLMVFTQRKWYPVRDVISDRGTLFIKTWVDETGHTAADQLVWLSKATLESEEDRTQLFFPQTEVEKAQLRARYATAIPQIAVRPTSPQPDLPASPAASSPDSPQENCSPTVAEALKQVTRYYQGKLYIQTPLGYLTVEGDNLKYALVPRSRS
ncbi:hypothetical protein [Leptolyngbya sp. PCC 6406]|uniref:hypothetical protein n=1 Tax=Leptolyngbya sp. PCC 6406 TaxID=1173264 RepID=UPI0002ACED79|nr:hypothetical protein [Leptolyngbya sp. PCC 6406]